MKFLFGCSAIFVIWGFFSYFHAETTGQMINGTLQFLMAVISYGSASIIQAIETLKEPPVGSEPGTGNVGDEA